MKKMILMLATILTLGTACADDKPISQDKLPEKAKQLIAAHFPETKVLSVTMDRDAVKTTYDVLFADRTKLEFDGKGEWKEIDCQFSAVPAALIPGPIAEFLAENHQGFPPVKIDRDKKGYDVKITGGLEMKFDVNCKFIRYDN